MLDAPPAPPLLGDAAPLLWRCCCAARLLWSFSAGCALSAALVGVSVATVTVGLSGTCSGLVAAAAAAGAGAAGGGRCP